jgi:hypothetical protein
MQPFGDDIFAVGTWWGTLDPAIPCELRAGALACPATELWVRIARDGQVLSEVTQNFFRSSVSVGNPSPPDAGMPDVSSAPVPPLPPDPATFTWSFPPGLTLLSRTIDSQGWFVAVLRDDHVAGVYRSPDAVSNWTRLGRRLGQVEEVQVGNTAGTYLIFARGTDSFFVPSQVWRDDADAPGGGEPELLQDSVQLVRPESNVAEVLNYGYAVSVNLTDDGLCAVNWEPTPSGRQLTIHDLAMNGAKRAFLFEMVGIGQPSSLWWPRMPGSEKLAD